MINLTVDGTDAIYLAGRNDVTVPPLGTTIPSFPLGRHPYVNSDFIPETFPTQIATSGGQQFSFSATGCVGYYNGLDCPTSGFGPDGGGGASSLTGLGGISGYNGPIGSLVGVFLGDGNPASTPAPTPIDFSSSGLGTDFTSLNVQLGQVFFIGDGITGSGTRQSFIAPTGATRIFVGIADGFGFVGAPGAYEDNDGAFQVTIDVKKEDCVGVNLVGTSNNDTLTGTACNDTLAGLNSQDVIKGLDGKDIIKGGDGDDTLYGGESDFWGKDGSDTILGGSGQDLIYGNQHDDRLYGEDGDDTLYGGQGKDSLTGGQGQDKLYGNSGNDYLNGGAGDNTLTGGAGSDRFLVSKAGKNLITDFQDGRDLLVLDAGLTFTDLSIFDQNGTTWITTKQNQPLAFLSGVSANLIGANDFAI